MSPLIMALIPVLVPLLLALVKKALPSIPSKYIPFLAPFVGAGLDVGQAYLTGVPMDPTLGAALGAAGTGLREIYDQWTKPGGNTPSKSGTLGTGDRIGLP